jgi:predicted nuclease with TOPRIM domain
MNPEHSYWILSVSTAVEILLMVLAIVFYLKLRKSELLVRSLQSKQQEFLQKLDFNARLEKEIVESFAQRQEELAQLEEKLNQRTTEMRRLLEQAENFTKSPQFLRQTILSGFRRGQSAETLAQATGLSVDEVELILDQPKTEF